MQSRPTKFVYALKKPESLEDKKGEKITVQVKRAFVKITETLMTNCQTIDFRLTVAEESFEYRLEQL